MVLDMNLSRRHLWHCLLLLDFGSPQSSQHEDVRLRGRRRLLKLAAQERVQNRLWSWLLFARSNFVPQFWHWRVSDSPPRCH